VFLVPVYLRSPSCLREMKVFDEVVLLVLRTGGWYGRGPPYWCSLNTRMPVLAFPFGPDRWLSA
jgi:hypothetical protein